MSAPTCVTCGALTYYVAEDRKHYCLAHLNNQESALFDKELSPEIVRRALANHAQVLHRSTLEAIEIDDADWEDLDLWYTIGYYWDLNVYTSDNGILCATLYPVNEGGQTQSTEPYPLIIDPTTAVVYPYIAEVR